MTPDGTEAAVRFLRRTYRSGISLESMAPDALNAPPVTNFDKLPGNRRKAIEGAIAKLDRPQRMSRPERMALEAIIIPDRRPAIAISNDDYCIAHQDWLHLNADTIKDRLRPAIRAVGRLELPSRPDIPYGGTGFLVGNNLLMTNRHVAELFIDGVGRGLTFRPGATPTMNFVEEAERTVPERFAITSVVLVHPYWDMALLRIEGPGTGPLTLAFDDPPDPDEDIVVIGFPAFNPRLDRAVQDEVFNGIYSVKRFQPGRRLSRRNVDSFGKTVNATTHDASTLGGNSGSAVISVATGQVVALHFGGAYLDTNYAVPMRDLALDSQLVDSGMNFASPRPSPIDGPWTGWWHSIEAPSADAPQSIPIPIAKSVGQGATVTVPLTITVSIGGPAGPSAASETADLERAVEPWRDTSYGQRKGYDPDFLGFAIPLPEPRKRSDLVSMADGSVVIPYMHFSIAMHRERRLALFTASNVRADPASRKPDPSREYTRDALGGLGEQDQEKWFSDPRLRGIEQLPDKFFSMDRKAFDKGHLVRRDDVAWGDSFEELRIANGDTYHVSNCSPQVSVFNRPGGTDNWGDLERAVLAQATAQRLSVFAGPVLGKDDPVFRGVDNAGPAGIRIPRAYWKIIVAPDGAGLGCYAFLLEQDLSGVAMERLEFDAKWRRSMIAVGELEQRIGALQFPAVLHDADRAGTSAAVAIAERANL